MQIKIDKITRNANRKDGTAYQDKRGRKFHYVTIMSNGRRMGYCDYENETVEWSEGQTVNVDVTQSGEFTNFEPIGGFTAVERPQAPQHNLEARIQDLDDKLMKLKKQHDNLVTLVKPLLPPVKEPLGVDKDEEVASDLPF